MSWAELIAAYVKHRHLRRAWTSKPCRFESGAATSAVCLQPLLGRNLKGKNMGIVDWPQAERPREKLLARGAAVLSDAELLAIFLRTGVSGKSAVDLARDLLTSFGSLRALNSSSLEQFC